MRRVRLGIAGLRGIPGVMGGVEAHVQELYPRIARIRSSLGVDVAMRRPYVEAGAKEWNGLRLWPIWATPNKFLESITHTFIALFFLRYRRRCDAVHLHAIGPGLLVPLARLLGLRVLFTHHGRDYDRAKWNRLAKAVLQFGEWLSIRFSDEVIVVSERLTDALRQRFPQQAERIHFVPNGASLTFANASRSPDPVLLASLGIEAGQYILGVGRLVPEKGFDDLIAAHLSSNDPRKLVIAGKADHADTYAKSLLAKAGNRVVFAGFQTHEALRSLYGGAALFVLPSHHEGLPIAALEALAMDTPTLLSDIAPNEELGLSPDHYFTTGNIAMLAERLRAPQECYAVDGSALRERYNWDKIATQTAAIIDRLGR
jgi:glycosyltransferase involved in cell wall biosynthesis